MLTDDQFQTICELLNQQAQATERLAIALERMVFDKQKSPSHPEAVEDSSNAEIVEMALAYKTPEQRAAESVSEAWETWATDDDAIVWAANQLPEWTLEQLTECFNTTPVSTAGNRFKPFYLVVESLRKLPEPERQPKPVVLEPRVLEPGQWKSKDDAITWGMWKLPTYSKEDINEIFDTIPASPNGKKGKIFVEEIRIRCGELKVEPAF